jgi:hypothetical protein
VRFRRGPGCDRHRLGAPSGCITRAHDSSREVRGLVEGQIEVGHVDNPPAEVQLAGQDRHLYAGGRDGRASPCVGRIEKLLWLPPVMQEVSDYVCS